MTARFLPQASAACFEMACCFGPMAAGGGTMDAQHVRRVLAALLAAAAQARLTELLDGSDDIAARRLYALAGLFERHTATGCRLTAADVALLCRVLDEVGQRLSAMELEQEQGRTGAALKALLPAAFGWGSRA